ncbi:MAG: M24 family metallopeptidase [Campylobacterales bacterium]
MNLILRSESSLYYECGYSCDNAFLLKIGSEKFFITDARYTLEAKSNIVGAEVVESSNLYKTIANILRQARLRAIYFDPSELSVKELDELSSKLHRVNFIVHDNYSQKIRAIKTKKEIELIAESVRLNALAFNRFFEFMKQDGVGKSEKALHFEAKRFLSNSGEYDLSFDPIVALNQNAAMPHALPTSLKLKKGDMVLFDAGIKYKRYCSDRTRTFEIGASSDISKNQHLSQKERQKIYDTVLKAQERAIEYAREGVSARSIDAKAREVIDSAGYGKLFTHSTGHGVGLDIHELPRISAKSKDIIEEGMVFTIEPGIYVDGGFGVRIEDVVVIKNGRAEIL